MRSQFLSDLLYKAAWNNLQRSGMEFSQVETEVIGLRAIVGSLDAMVNHKMLRLANADRETEVSFGISTHQQLFNVLLVDFLEPVDSLLTGVRGSCLDVLQQVCRMPMFDDDGSVEFLSIPVNALQGWLDTEVVIETWFPSIDTNGSYSSAGRSLSTSVGTFRNTTLRG